MTCQMRRDSLTKSRTVAALACVMEGLAAGMCPNIEIELMTFFVVIFACDSSSLTE